jgi:hypothetical protein
MPISDFKVVVALILLVLFSAVSVGIYTGMVSIGMVEWWQITIPLCFLWLFYAGIVRVLQLENSQYR